MPSFAARLPCSENQQYWVGMTNAYASTGFESIIVGQPRIFGARVRARFGS